MITRYFAAIEPPDYPATNPMGLYRVMEDDETLDLEYFSRDDEWVSESGLIHIFSDPDVVEITKDEADAVLEKWAGDKSVKHLAGQHDQSTHGSGGGATYLSGNAAKSALKGEDFESWGPKDVDYATATDLDLDQHARRRIAKLTMQNIEITGAKPHVLKAGDEIVGIAATAKQGKNVVLHDMATKRPGYGKQMIVQVAREAAKSGGGIQLYALDSAVEFYQKLGFKETGRNNKMELDAGGVKAMVKAWG